LRAGIAAPGQARFAGGILHLRAVVWLRDELRALAQAGQTRTALASASVSGAWPVWVAE
jgi:hypothetical protein